MSCKCNNPVKSKCIPWCVDQICLGKITDLSEDVYIYIRNVTTDKVNRFASSSGSYGSVCLNIESDDINF